MPAREEVVDGGRKIVLRRDNGELAGSRPIAGKAGIAAPTSPAVPFPGQSAEQSSLDLDDLVTELNREHTAEDPYADVDADFDAVAHREEWFAKQPTTMQVGYLTTRALPTGMGEDQARYVFEAYQRSVKRWDVIPEAPTDAEWETYLEDAAARLSDPDNMLDPASRADALARLGALSIGPKPDGYTFAVMSGAPSRMWKAHYELDDQARQIGSWVDADEFEVKRMITKYRNEYYALADAGQTPEISAQYYGAWRRGGGAYPKDPATAYSHWKAENPELYLNPETPKRFVALDLETTGISTKDFHIIEVGLVEYDAKGREIGRWNQLVCPPPGPDGTISTGDEKVRSVHGIVEADVIGQPKFEEILPELRSRLAGATVIGHNLGFDVGHLKANFRKHAPAGDKEAAKAPWTGEADTMYHAARHMDGLENNKLVTVSHALGISYTHGHRAEHDARASGEVFFAIRKTLKRRQAAAIRAAGAAGGSTAV